MAKNRLGMSFLLVNMLIVLSAPNVDAFTGMFCNCTEPQRKGIIDLGHLKLCNEPAIAVEPVPVSYDVIQIKGQEHQFSGYHCHSRRRGKKVDSFFFGGIDTQNIDEILPVSPDACWAMVTTNTCHGELMTVEGQSANYDYVPAAQWRYLRTTEITAINCHYQKVTLQSDCPSCPITSVFGVLASHRSVGFSVKSHHTYVWNATPIKKDVDCNITIIASGSGDLSKLAQNLPRNKSRGSRLRDTVLQLDFHLDNQHVLCNKEMAYDVIGHPALLVRILTKPKENATNKYTFKRRQAQTTNHTIRDFVHLKDANLSKDLKDFLALHLQFVQDSFNIRETQIANELTYANCQRDSLQFFQTSLLSQYSGVLAAQTMQLPLCSSATAYGNTVLIKQCKPVNVTFGAIITACGAQPTFENITIARDGWTLTNYIPCAWKNGLVRFNDALFEWQNQRWEKIIPTLSLMHHQFDNNYTEYDDNSAPLFAALQKESSIMQSLSEITAFLDEESITPTTHFSDFIKQEPKIGWLTSIVETIKHMFFWGGMLAAVATFGYLWYRLRVTSLLRVFVRAQLNRLQELRGQNYEIPLNPINAPVTPTMTIRRPLRRNDTPPLIAAPSPPHPHAQNQDLDKVITRKSAPDLTSDSLVTGYSVDNNPTMSVTWEDEQA